jgi:anti-anti-sigma factor
MPYSLYMPSRFGCLSHAADNGDMNVAVSGELDVATAHELDRALRKAQADGAPVTLDLRRLEFMDCRGMSVVIAAAARARAVGERFLIVRGPPNVDRLFELTGNTALFELAG